MQHGRRNLNRVPDYFETWEKKGIQKLLNIE
jgi:hypothetical protein